MASFNSELNDDLPVISDSFESLTLELDLEHETENKISEKHEDTKPNQSENNAEEETFADPLRSNYTDEDRKQSQDVQTEETAMVEELPFEKSSSSGSLDPGILGTVKTNRDVKQDPLCSLCDQDKRTEKAEKYCKECYLYFCLPCVENHNKYPLNRGHQLVDKSQMKGPRETIVSFPNRRCAEHPGELINMYCRSHDIVCCNVCRALNHSACYGIQHLPEAARNIRHDAVYQTTVANLTSIVSEMDNNVQRKEDDKTRVWKEKLDIINSIDQHRQEINQHLDRIEKQSLDELERKEKRILKELAQHVKTLKLEKVGATDLLKKLESFEGENECELFVDVKEGERLAGHLAAKVAVIKGYTPSIEFHINERINGLLSELPCLGVFCSSVNMKFPSDEFECGINDILLLKSGKVLVVDTNNSKLKRLDENYKMKDAIQLPGDFPGGVCYIGNNQVAVTVGEFTFQRNDETPFKVVDKSGQMDCALSNPKVHIVTLKETTMVLTASFPIDKGLDWVCGKFTSMDNCLYFIGCSRVRLLQSPTVVIKGYSVSGILKKSINIECVNAPRGLRGSFDGTMFYICDRYQDVVVVDTQGRLLWKTSFGADFVGAFDIHPLSKSRVIVCSCLTCNVIVLDIENGHVGIILSKADGLGTTKAVCYDEKEKKLLVSCFKWNNMFIYDCNVPTEPRVD